MTPLFRSPILGGALACSALLLNPVHGSGLILYEIATADVGLAAAGYATRAADASTVFTNPAGMNELEGAQFATGVQALYGDVTFHPDDGTSARLGSEGGGNAMGWLPAANTFVVVPLGEKWRAGFGALSYFGLAEKYDADWVGRYYVQEGTLIGLSLTPSLSCEVTDWLSLGGGLNAMYCYFDNQVAVNNILGADGRMSLRDRTWGFGGYAGILLKPGKDTRLGLTYVSAVELDFSDTPTFSGLGPGMGLLLANPSSLDVGLTVPQTAMLSASQALSDRWTLMANAGWQDWSQFGYVQAGVDVTGTTTLNLHYQDSYHGALGAQFQASPKWLLSTGVAYDSSPVSDEDRTVTIPVGEQWRLGVGAQYQVSDAIQLGLACTFLWAGDLPVDQGSPLSLRGRVSGAFDDAWFAITALSLNWKF